MQFYATLKRGDALLQLTLTSTVLGGRSLRQFRRTFRAMLYCHLAMYAGSGHPYTRQKVAASILHEDKAAAEETVIEGKPQAVYWRYWALTRTGIYFLNVYAEPRTRIEFYDVATQRTRPVLELEKLPVWAQTSLSATADGKTIYYAQQDFQGIIKKMEFQQ